METPSFSYKLYSRPGQCLIDHLSNTAVHCSETIRHTLFQFNPAIDADIVYDIAELIGFTHDLGKSTQFFQDYLDEADEDKKRSMRNDKRTHHGFLSSLFTYRVVRDYLTRRNFATLPSYEFLPIISFLVVKKHHGNLINLKDEIHSVSPGNKREILSTIKAQLDSIAEDEFNTILNKSPHIHITLPGFIKAVDTLITEAICREEQKRRRKFLKDNTDTYFLFQFLYSALLGADKNDAAGLGASRERASLPADLVDRYIEKKFADKKEDNFINPIRDEIYKTVCNASNSIDVDDKLLSINVPTGTGKTLTGLSFALKLRKRIGSENGFVPKIIYCLPFLSVIEQNYTVFEDLFEVVTGRRPHSGELLKHHHLAEISYREGPDKAEFPTDISRLLIEGWESELVVTTFMQLFHTLISSRNRMLRKFNAITNAIVILDEIQTVPCKYWHLVRKVLIRFSEIFNTRFIFMTATKPLIFKPDEVRELVPSEQKDHYLSRIDRISFVNRSDEEMELQEFIEVLKTDIEAWPEDDFLIVLNTINTSIDIYEALKVFITEEKYTDVKLYYLSTNIIPKHRLERIEGAEGIKQAKCRKIIVSTQLVEAGVDIDVDRVYRDFAPFDSVNQVAGRCNRNFSMDRKKGVVTLFRLKNGKPYYQYIYGKSDQSIFYTKDILKGRKALTEERFLKLGDEFFKKMAEDVYDVSTDLIAHLYKLNFEEIKAFKLIDTQYPTVDLFIEIDEEASQIWQAYINALESSDPIQRNNLLSGLKRELYHHIISVPIKHSPYGSDDESTFVFINKEQVPTIYHVDTGFIRKDPVQSVF